MIYGRKRAADNERQGRCYCREYPDAGDYRLGRVRAGVVLDG